MKRIVFLLLAVFLLAACGGSLKPSNHPSIHAHSRMAAVSYHPKIAGVDPTVGQVLTTTNGTWTNNPTSFTYQWQHCLNSTCTNVGADLSTYTVASGDVGDTIQVLVHANNFSGSSANVASAQTVTVTSGSSSGGPCNGCTWNGDYHTSDFGQYDDCNAANLDGQFPRDYAIDTASGGTIGPNTCGGLGSPALVHDITPPSGFTDAARFTVNSTSTHGGEAGLRALDTLFPTTNPTLGKSRAFQGATTWYRDEIYFPSSFAPLPNTIWNWVWEMHDQDGPCCAHLSLGVVTDSEDGGASGSQRLSLRTEGGGSSTNSTNCSSGCPVDLAPKQNNQAQCTTDPTCLVTWSQGPTIANLRNQWIDLVFRVVWDWRSNANGGVGHVDYWVNGVKYMNYSGPTLYYRTDSLGGAGPDQGYVDEGYYRDSTAFQVDVVYHAASMDGASEASVGETGLP